MNNFHKLNLDNFNKLSEYTKYLQERNLAANSIVMYQSLIGIYCQKNKELNQENVNDFFKELVKDHEPNSCLVYRQALASFARFLKVEIDWRRINKLIPKQVKKFYITITLKELEKLKENRLEKNEKIYQRNNLMLDFLFYSGLRISELVNIKHQDWQGKSLRVLGKGNKIRYIPLPPFLSKYFQP